MPDQNKENRLQILAQKLADGKITQAEQLEFDEWYNSFDDRTLNATTGGASFIKKELYEKITLKENINTGTTFSLIRLWKPLSIAASILILLSIGNYFFTPIQTKPKLVKQPTEKSKILPGTNKAMLTLANGKKIVLNDINNGQVAVQDGAIILKTTDGHLAYNKQTNFNKTGSISYNTVETPKGGQYQIKLPDGTMVWLNAASNLHYPTAFTGGERRVELSGEAYFEVAKNKDLPFRVVSRGQTVEVLGTHFNINSYADEPAQKTTLLEGSVKVSQSNMANWVMLSPNQQAILHNNHLINIPADTEAEVAWKNGLFQFNNTPLKAVMRQMARWYDLKIKYEGNAPKRVFTGKLHRSASVEEFFKILEYSNIHYVIDDRTVIIKI